MKFCVPLIFLILFFLSSCEKDYGKVKGKLGVPAKKYLVELDLIVEGQDKVLPYYKISKVAEFESVQDDSEVPYSTLKLEFNGSEHIITSQPNFYKGMDSALTIPPSTWVSYTIYVEDDTVTGKVLTAEPLTYEENAFEMEVNTDNNDIRIFHNLKDSFSNYYYIFNERKVNGEFLRNNRDITSLLYFRTMGYKLFHCLPVPNYPTGGSLGFQIAKVKNGSEQFLGRGTIGDLMSRPTHHQPNLNQKSVYGFVNSYVVGDAL